VYTAISPARFFLASPSHIFSASLLPVFQISFCEAFSLFYAAQLLRGGTPMFPDKQKAGIAPDLCLNILSLYQIQIEVHQDTCSLGTGAIPSGL
jgi:hypothetical protein